MWLFTHNNLINKHLMNTNASAYRAHWSKDGSINPAKVGQGEPTTLEGARIDAHEAAKRNKSVTILYCDAGLYCAENKGKWFLLSIIK